MWIGRVALEDEVAAVLDLADGVKAPQADAFALLGRQLGPENQGPVVQPFADECWVEPVGRSLQGQRIIDGQKRVVVLAKAYAGAIQLLLDEGVAVEIVRGLEWKERGHAHRDGAQGLVSNVEVVVRETALLGSEDAVVWILGRILRNRAAKRRPLLHALEDEIDAIGMRTHRRAQPSLNVVLLAHTLLGPLDGRVVIASECLDPVLILPGAPTQHLLVDDLHADHVAEEIDDLFGSRQCAQVAVDDNSIEAVVDEHQQACEQLGEEFHLSAPP